MMIFSLRKRGITDIWRLEVREGAKNMGGADHEEAATLERHDLPDYGGAVCEVNELCPEVEGAGRFLMADGVRCGEDEEEDDEVRRDQKGSSAGGRKGSPEHDMTARSGNPHPMCADHAPSTAGTVPCCFGSPLPHSGIHGGGVEASEAMPSTMCLDQPEDDAANSVRASRDGEPEFHLHVDSGKYADSVFKISNLKEVPSIGRSRRNNVSLLADDQVSRFHAYFELLEDGSVVIKDGNHETGSSSSNGTFVNSNCTRIDSKGYKLHYGDVISIGATDLHVVKGTVQVSTCTTPVMQVHARSLGLDYKPAGWRSTSKDACSQRFTSGITLTKKVALLMSSHQRLGRDSAFGQISDPDLVDLILSFCTIVVTRHAPPPQPHALLASCPLLPRSINIHRELEAPLPLSAPLLPGGPTAQEYLDASMTPSHQHRLQVVSVRRVHNSSLWKMYHWKRQQIVEGLPELEALPSTQHLREHPMEASVCLDADANEFLLFYTQGQGGVSGEDERNGSNLPEGCGPSMFGGGLYLSDSAHRVNSFVPCAACKARGECDCGGSEAAEEAEYTMSLARVMVGDAHIVRRYDQDMYRGSEMRLRTRAPINASTGRLHDSIVAEKVAYGGVHTSRDIVVYDRFQCCPEYIVNYRRVKL